MLKPRVNFSGDEAIGDWSQFVNKVIRHADKPNYDKWLVQYDCESY